MKTKGIEADWMLDSFSGLNKTSQKQLKFFLSLQFSYEAQQDKLKSQK